MRRYSLDFFVGLILKLLISFISAISLGKIGLVGIDQLDKAFPDFFELGKHFELELLLLGVIYIILATIAFGIYVRSPIYGGPRRSNRRGIFISYMVFATGVVVAYLLELALLLFAFSQFKLSF